MQIPRGKPGIKSISKMSRLIVLFNFSKKWVAVAIHMLQIFLLLVLQKPSFKTKNREHIKYLNKKIG